MDFKLSIPNLYFLPEKVLQSGENPPVPHFPINNIFEFHRPQRFDVKFPSHWDINEAVVKEVSALNFNDNHWDDITIKLYDTIAPNAAIRISSLLHTIGNNGINEIINLQRIDPTGVVIETLDIHISCIKSFDFGNLSYDSDDINMLSIILVVEDILFLENQ